MKRSKTASLMTFIVSMLIFGTIGIFRRYIPLSSGMLAFSRGIMGAFFLWIFTRFGKKEKAGKPSTGDLLLLILTGMIIGVNWILLFEAYERTTVATATLCYYMQPTIVMLLSPVIFRERLTLKKTACAVVSLIGMVLVSGFLSDNETSPSGLSGIILGLGAAVFYSGAVILNKLIRTEDAFERTKIQLFAAGMVMVPYLLITEDFGSIKLTPTAAAMTLCVGILHTGIAYAMYFGSMASLEAQSLAVLSYIDPVFAMLLSALVLGERMTAQSAVGAVLIIGSAVISELRVRSVQNSE